MKNIIFFFLALFSIQLVDAQQLIGVLRLIADKPINQGPTSKEKNSGSRSTELHVYGLFKMETKSGDDNDDDDDNNNDNNNIPYYELLKKKENLTPSVLETNRGISIQDAVNRTISSCRCGEFLMNAEIYSYKNAYVVVGDVYGRKSASCLWQVGDTVSCGENFAGVIVSIKDEDVCIVKSLLTGRQKTVSFSNIFKLSDEFHYFNIGDTVSWGNNLAGVIISYKDEEICIVKSLLTENQMEISYSNIFKVSNDYYYFKVGDKVSWKAARKYKTGVIIAIRDEDKCLVKEDETGKQKNIYRDELFRLGAEK